jgi:hypothetical protein
MSEDRFDDLGGDADTRAPGAADRTPGDADPRTPGERLAERDQTHPEPRKGPPQVQRPGNKYAWLVGILMLMALGVLLFTTTLPNAGEGVQGPVVGKRLSAFAAPLSSGNFSGDADANVCQRAKCPKGAGARPACETRGREILTICPRRTRPLVLTFIATRGTDCEPQIDRVERMKDDFPGVDFAAVMSGEDVERANQIASSRRWTQPLGVDHDGAVVNLYGIGVCPVTVFARDGIVRKVELGNLTEDQLRARTKRLLR